MSRENSMPGSRYKCWLDWIIILSLFLGGVYVGKAYLSAIKTDRSAIVGTELLYGPPAMFAAGRGFYQPNTKASPELRAFLRNEVETLDPKTLPANIPAADSAVASYHRYLLYVVAVFWVAFGISWGSLELLAAIMFGWCAVAIYGLFRLGMGRIISIVLAVVVMLSPPMLIMMPHLRDFGKAPFILTTIFLLAYLIKSKPTWARLRFLLPLLGLLIGIGLGFRQDIIIFIPPAILIVCISLYRVGSASFLRRIGIFILFLVCLFGMAWPMLGRMEGGAEPYHPLVQGYSMKRMESLGIEPAAYAPLACGQDNYVFSVLYDYYRRVNHEPKAHFKYNSPGAEAAGRQWLIEMGIHFPADILTRGYASVLRSLRYADAYTPWFTHLPPGLRELENIHLDFAAFMHRFGLFLGLAALLLIGVRNFTAGLGLIVFVVYVFGYVGLQCEFRHAFHLAFIPFWVLGFLINIPFGALRFRKADDGSELSGPGFTSVAKATLLRAFAFILCSVILVVIPLEILRFYQQHEAKAVVAPIIAAPLKYVETVNDNTHGWALFNVEQASDELPEVEKNNITRTDLQALWAMATMFVDRFALEAPVWDTQARLMMAEFDASRMPKWLYIRYTSRGAWNDFSQVVHLPVIPAKQGTVRYYFPVYELYMSDDRVTARNIFAGVGVPEKDADSLMNLYQVTNVSECSFLVHLMANASDVFLPLYQRLNFSPDFLYYYLVENDPVGVGIMAEAAERAERKEEAVFFYCTAMLLSRDGAFRIYLSRRLLQIGALEAAVEGVLDPRNDSEEFAGLKVDLLLDIGMQCELLGNVELLEKILPVIEKIIEHASPGRLGQTTAFWSEHGNKQAALRIYKKMILTHPEDASMIADIKSLLHPNENVSFWKEITETAPESIAPWIALGIAYEEAGEMEAAKQAYIKAHENDPENAEAALRCFSAVPEYCSPDEMIGMIDKAVAKAPELGLLAAECLEKAGAFYTQKGQHDNACKLLGAAMRFAPENQFAAIHAAEALAIAGDIAGAREQLVALLLKEPHDSVAAALQRLLLEHAADGERLDFWSAQASRGDAPEYVKYYYACELAQAGRYAEAADLFDALQQQGYGAADMELRQRIAQLAINSEEQETALHIYVKEQCPEQTSLALQLLLQTAQNLNDRKHPAEAEVIVREALALSSETEAAWLALGDALVLQDKSEDVLQVYTNAFQSMSTGTQLALRIDNYFEQTGNREMQYETWRNLAEQHPQNEVVRLHWGMACESIGAYNEAKEAYSGLIEAAQCSGIAKVRLGGVLACLGESEAGRRMIEEAVAADSSLNSLAAWVCQNAGQVLSETDKFAEAVLLYQLAASYAPEDLFPWLKMGEMLQRQGKTADALTAYRRVIQASATSPPAMEAARQIDAMLNPDKRVAFWAELAVEMPEALLPSLRYGFSQMDTDIETAAAVVERLMKHYSENAEMQLLQGIIWCGTGKLQEGLVLVKQSVATAPYLATEGAAHLATIAKTAMEKSDNETALAMLQHAVSLAPDNLAYTLMLGETFLARGENGAAIEEFQKILMKIPESPRSAQLLDDACKKLDTPDVCRDIWQKIVDAHPDAQLPRKYLGE